MPPPGQKSVLQESHIAATATQIPLSRMFAKPLSVTQKLYSRCIGLS